MSDSAIDRLRQLAEQTIGGDAGDGSLERQLSASADAAGLRDLAYELTPHPEVSVPIYRRLIELDPADPDLAAELGFIFWLGGDDALAREQVRAGRRLDPDNVQTLLLEAALEQHPGEKRRLYGRVLELDPDNRIARDNLKGL